MQPFGDSVSHLTYCTNIHPGESWNEVFRNVGDYVPALKARLSPDAPFGIGLRLSDQASRDLRRDGAVQEFKNWLSGHEAYVFTLNGFPYGGFHGTRVKDNVYRPDWTTTNRVDYTIRLANILAELLPRDCSGGISTSPVSYKHWHERSRWDAVLEEAGRNYAKVAAHLYRLQERTGLFIHLDVEPEPDCLIENTSETIEFFTRWLDSVGVACLKSELGLKGEEASEILRDYVRLCYDTCHFAVEFEDPQKSLKRFIDAGIRLGKVQISSALHVEVKAGATARRHLKHALGPFAESTYLHQVVERFADGSISQYPDLDGALESLSDTEARQWRIHYHVPIFMDRFDDFASTQQDIEAALEIVLRKKLCSHFEIETYTWDVLPEDLKAGLGDSILREYQWVLERFGDGR